MTRPPAPRSNSTATAAPSTSTSSWRGRGAPWSTRRRRRRDRAVPGRRCSGRRRRRRRTTTTTRPRARPALTADTEALAAAATAAVRRAVDEDGIAADRVFVGGFDGGGAAALAVACQLDVAIGGYFCRLRRARRRRRGLPSSAGRGAGGPAARGVAVKFGRDRATADDAKNLADSFSARGFAVEAGTRTSTPRTARASSGPAGRARRQRRSPRSCPNRRRPSRGRSSRPASRRPRTASTGRAWATRSRRSGAGRTRAIFTVPDGAEERLAKYPIYCNNSAFDVKARGPGRLATAFVSPTPEATARTIAARLTARLTDPGGTGAEDSVCGVRRGFFDSSLAARPESRVAAAAALPPLRGPPRHDARGSARIKPPSRTPETRRRMAAPRSRRAIKIEPIRRRRRRRILRRTTTRLLLHERHDDVAVFRREEQRPAPRRPPARARRRGAASPSSAAATPSTRHASRHSSLRGPPAPRARRAHEQRAARAREEPEERVAARAVGRAAVGARAGRLAEARRRPLEAQLPLGAARPSAPASLAFHSTRAARSPPSARRGPLLQSRGSAQRRAEQQRAVEGLVALRRRERPALREDELLRVDAAERRVAAAVEHLDVLDVQHAEEAPEGEAAARVGRGRVQELRAGARLEEREVVGPHRRVADLGELALVREAPARRRDGKPGGAPSSSRASASARRRAACAPARNADR